MKPSLLLAAFAILGPITPLRAEDPAPAAIEAPAVEKLEGTSWKWESGGTLRLLPKGVATHTRWNSKGKWKRNKKGDIELSGPKTSFVLQFMSETKAFVTSKGQRHTVITQLKDEKPE